MVGEAAVTDSEEEEEVTDLAGEVEDTLLSVVVVTHLADSPAVGLVRDSARRGDFLLVDFLVAEITAALVTVVSVDAIATFAIVAFAILMGAFSISAAPALDIQITPTITHIRTTTTMGI
jgi:predicted small integral membrane protein